MIELSKTNLLKWAKKYDVWSMTQRVTKDDEDRIMATLRKQSFLNKADYKEIVDWKSPRVRNHCDKNTDEYIEEISRFSFSSKNEQVKIEVLTLLRGTSFPVASAILHFKYPKQYPVVDYRVLELLDMGSQPIKYTFELWWSYVQEIRKISRDVKIDNLRTLDKALWFYAKKQGGNKK